LRCRSHLLLSSCHVGYRLRRRVVTGEEIRSLEAALDKAGKGLVGKGQAREVVYGLAYQKLVLAGARPQLRKKYRVGVR